jgi:hypothetical protein
MCARLFFFARFCSAVSVWRCPRARRVGVVHAWVQRVIYRVCQAFCAPAAVGVAGGAEAAKVDPIIAPRILRDRVCAVSYSILREKAV